jgi:ATP-dependent helicase HrpB
MGFQLPVKHIRTDFCNALTTSNKCILRAPPGSGKSTLIPQFLYDDVLPKDKTVIVLQPRRIAARMLATFIAKQRNVDLGNEVGYQVRLEGMNSQNTRILFVTEGILLHRLLKNDQLKEAGAIIFDEFHERHLETDLSLALTLKLQSAKRSDLKIVVMSATLEIEQVKQFLGNCPVLQTEGKAYPVSIQYRQPKPYEAIWDFAAYQADIAMASSNEGSALIFMPGAYEIRKTLESIRKRQALQSFEVYPLHGSLTREEQEKAVRSGDRKIIVSTNVAETSLTIPNITCVIDSGLARIARFDPKRGINTLFIEPISVSSADQRAGRAGRIAPGTCIRLWSEFEHQTRAYLEKPEIHRVDLSETVLGLLASGISSLANFTWLEKPDPLAVEKSIQLLIDLGALDANNQITGLGKRMANLSLHPRFSRMLLRAEELDCLPSACVVAAIAQSPGLLFNTSDPVIRQERNHTFGNPGSDLLFEFNAWLWAGMHQFKHSECSYLGINTHLTRQIGQLALQILQRVDNNSHKNKKLPQQNLTGDEASNLRNCIFTGFADFLTIRHRLNSPTCQMMHGRSGKLHQESIVQDSRMLVATELEEAKTPTGVQLILRKVTEVDEEWLGSSNLHGSEKVIYEQFDSEQKKVVHITELRVNDLVLSRQSALVEDDEKASQILTEAILHGKIEFPQWNEEVEHFTRRVNFASKHAPQYEIPTIDDDAKEFIIQQTIYKCRSAKDIQKCNIWPALKAWLSYEQTAAVDLVAPVTVTLPRRKNPVKLRYDEKGDVILSETIQGLYDCPVPLLVAEGKVPVVFEILAPSRRPVQITRDLDYFWKNSYLEIKKELKGRYPKHEWR